MAKFKVRVATKMKYQQGKWEVTPCDDLDEAIKVASENSGMAHVEIVYKGKILHLQR